MRGDAQVAKRARDRTVRSTAGETASGSRTGEPSVTSAAIASGWRAARARARVPPRLCPIRIAGDRRRSASVCPSLVSSRPAQSALTRCRYAHPVATTAEPPRPTRSATRRRPGSPGSAGHPDGSLAAGHDGIDGPRAAWRAPSRIATLPEPALRRARAPSMPQPSPPEGYGARPRDPDPRTGAGRPGRLADLTAAGLGWPHGRRAEATRADPGTEPDLVAIHRGVSGRRGRHAALLQRGRRAAARDPVR